MNYAFPPRVLQIYPLFENCYPFSFYCQLQSHKNTMILCHQNGSWFCSLSRTRSHGAADLWQNLRLGWISWDNLAPQCCLCFKQRHKFLKGAHPVGPTLYFNHVLYFSFFLWSVSLPVPGIGPRTVRRASPTELHPSSHFLLRNKNGPLEANIHVAVFSCGEAGCPPGYSECLHPNRARKTTPKAHSPWDFVATIRQSYVVIEF